MIHWQVLFSSAVMAIFGERDMHMKLSSREKIAILLFTFPSFAFIFILWIHEKLSPLIGNSCTSQRSI